MSVRSGVMGMDSVAKRTLVAILRVRNVCNINTNITHFYLHSESCFVALRYFEKYSTSAFHLGSDFYASPWTGCRGGGGYRREKEHFQISRTQLTPCCNSWPSTEV